MKNLNLPSIVCTFDQALFAKAAEIAWKYPDEYSPVVLNLGGFHLICNFMSIIGKRYEDAGLKDILIESGATAEGSASGILSGKHYNRGVRAHKLMYEALMRLVFQSFPDWIDEHCLPNSIAIKQTIRKLEHLTDADTDEWESIIASEEFRFMAQRLQEYVEHLRKNHGSLSALWIQYLDMVEILLALIRATREGNWGLYLTALRKVIPWCFAYDHMNYARYLTAYYSTMLILKETHPEIHEAFENGEFSVQIGKHNPFGRIPADQTIEETVNRDTQTPGGTKGFSKKQGTLQRFYLLSHTRSNHLRAIRQMTRTSDPHFSHPDLSQRRIRRDENDVNNIINLLTNEWSNPILDSSAMVCISTGVVATEDVSEQLLRAEEIGEQAYQNFKIASIPVGKSSADFFKPIKKQNLKTFTNMKSAARIRTPKVDLVLKCDRGVFARMAIIAQIRQLDLREVFSFPLGPLPWALAAPDGSLRKTSKCKLLEALSTGTEPPNLQGNSAMIIDGMDLLQKLIHPPTTFGSLAETILSTGIMLSPGCQRIDIVFDTYKDISIKSLERERRARVFLEERLDNLSAGQRIRNWKGLLSSSKGKKAMLRFLCKEMKDEKYSRKLVQRLIISIESECYCLTNNGVSSVAELISTQEEADTKILLHAKHAAQEGFNWIILSCQDTDISVIALHFALHCTLPK